MRTVVVFLCALFVAVPVFAQPTVPGIDASVTAELTPRYPEPDSVVQMRLRSSVIDLERANITWSIDERVVHEGYGVQAIEVRTGALGSRTEITAEIEGDLANAEAHIVLVPTEMDLVWESDSYTPAFYIGRALPSAGSTIRLQAMPRFEDANGRAIAPTGLVYTWRRNGAPIAAISGVGKSRASIQAPGLFGTDTIEVEARTPDGLTTSVKSVRISSVEPLLALYKNHPLYGIMFNSALSRNAEVPEEELSFAAIPYFADATNANNPSLRYEWIVNGETISPDPNKPNGITIDATGSTGVAEISLALSHTTNFFLKAAGSWLVTFTNVAEIIDPFRPTL